MLTVFDDHEKVFKAICAGASGYLLKTSPVERIVESIHEALAGGAPMTPRVASAVLQMFSQLAQPKQDYGLTTREQKILELMTKGLIKKEIADQLTLELSHGGHAPAQHLHQAPCPQPHRRRRQGAQGTAILINRRTP